MEHESKIVKNVTQLWRRLVWWFMSHFMNHKVKEVETRGFKFTFRKYSVTVQAGNGFWTAKFRSDFIASPMLFYCAEKNDLNALFGFAAKLYETSDFLARADQGFVDGLTRELNKYIKRLEKKAETRAAEVTKEQEAGDDALMRESAKYNRKDKVQREKDRETMREAIAEMKNKQGKLRVE
jgi:hypothetical protein